MTDYAGYTLLMALATTTLVKAHLCNIFASTAEYYRHSSMWVVPTQIVKEKRMDMFDIARFYSVFQKMANMVGLALLLGFAIVYATTYANTITANWHPTQMWTVGVQWIFFVFLLLAWALKTVFYSEVNSLVWAEQRQSPLTSLRLIMQRYVTGKKASGKILLNVTKWMGWPLSVLTPMSFVAYTVLSAVLITAPAPTGGFSIAVSGFPALDIAKTAQAGWGILAFAQLLVLISRRLLVLTDLKNWSVRSWFSKLGAIIVNPEEWLPNEKTETLLGPAMTYQGEIIPHSFLKKCGAVQLDSKLLSKVATADKKNEVYRLGSSPQSYKNDHYKVLPGYLVKRAPENTGKTLDLYRDVLYFTNPTGDVCAVTKQGFLEATEAGLVPEGDTTEAEETQLGKYAEALSAQFKKANTAEGYMFMKAAAPVHLTFDDIYGWGFGMGLQTYVTGWVVGAFNVLDLTTAIAFLGNGPLGFIFYFITTGWPTLVAIFSDMGSWWELVAWHKLVGILLVQMNKLWILPASAQVLEPDAVWERPLTNTVIGDITETQNTLAVVGTVVAILALLDGFWQIMKTDGKVKAEAGFEIGDRRRSKVRDWGSQRGGVLEFEGQVAS